ncbi:hypothetical protein V6Z11_A09G112300 [Gossypium hirsutum]
MKEMFSLLLALWFCQRGLSTIMKIIISSRDTPRSAPMSRRLVIHIVFNLISILRLLIQPHLIDSSSQRSKCNSLFVQLLLEFFKYVTSIITCRHFF